MKNYWTNLIFPVFWLVFMTVLEAINFIPPQYGDYFFMVYFGGFFVYFVFIRKEFSINELLNHWKEKMFWKQIGLTIILLVLTYGIGYLPTILLPNNNIVFIQTSFLRAYNLPTSIAFFFSAILFPAIGQELFYRKAIIRFDSPVILVFTLIVGSILFGINDNLDLFGIIKSSMLGLGFAISYIKTKNIYIPITAHYTVSIVLTVLFMFI